MKTLAELRAKIEAVPCVFASSNTQATDGFPESSENESNLKDGIPLIYATGRNSPPLLDFNRLGAMATKELFHRQRGGVHTFSPSAISMTGGYGNGIVLAFDDGVNVFEVESQTVRNNKDFVADPSAIGNLTRLPDDALTVPPRVLWRRVTPVHGLDDRLRLSVDFSRRTDVAPGETLTTDSLVVVGAAYFEDPNPHSYDETSVVSVKGIVTLVDGAGEKTFALENKGYAGFKVEEYFLGLFSPPYPAELCGTANYSVSFFAKAGTAVTVRLATKKKGTETYGTEMTLEDGVYAYPVAIIKE